MRPREDRGGAKEREFKSENMVWTRIYYGREVMERIIQDDVLQRLVTFPNVIVSSHQAYFTDTALQNISSTTIANLTAFENGEDLVNEVTLAMLH